jgi:hypothetical protein
MKYALPIGILAVLGAALFVLWPSETPAPAPYSEVPNTQLNNQTSVSISTSSDPAPLPVQKVQTILPTIDGVGVLVKNFLPSDTSLEASEGGDIIIAENEWYRVTYYLPTQGISVFLLQEPLGDARHLAESHVIELLGITQSDACRIFHLVAAPGEVNAVYAGKNLGFSFCPGATAL